MCVNSPLHIQDKIPIYSSQVVQHAGDAMKAECSGGGVVDPKNWTVCKTGIRLLQEENKMSKLTLEAAQEIVKEFMNKDDDYVYEKRDEMIFGKAKCSLVVYEMCAQGEIDERTRDFYLERAIYRKGYQHFRTYILIHEAARQRKWIKKNTENLDNEEYAMKTKMSTEEIEHLVATVNILQGESRRIKKSQEAEDGDEDIYDYWCKVLAATMALGETILNIRGIRLPR